MTTTKRIETRDHQLAAAQALSDGIALHKASLPTQFSVGTQPYKPDDIATLLQKRITLGKAVLTAKAAYEAALKAEQDQRAQTKLVIDTFRRLVLVLFMQLPDVLATFGLSAPKPRKPTVATKAAGAAKASAKRKAKTEAIAAIDAGHPAPVAPAPKPVS